MSEQSNIFISWSGDRSEWVARALYEFLPIVIQTAKPWLSTFNIDKGSKGLPEVTSKLSGMKVGICCLTPENLKNDWILYEAGALSKTIDDETRLCTYLLGGLKNKEVAAPLGMFQSTQPEKEDTRKLLHDINKAINTEPLSEKVLDRVFDKMWPDFEEKLKNMPEVKALPAVKRSTDEILTDLLQLARAEANSRKNLEAQVANIESVLDRAPYGGAGIRIFTSPGTFNALAGKSGLTAQPVETYFSNILREYDTTGNDAAFKLTGSQPSKLEQEVNAKSKLEDAPASGPAPKKKNP